ncbi:hypothetical protein ACFVYR_01415 [Streptomyces sp. NPDC058284]|uniref:hypothetical protein n=1 Tax=unclassified Streptomyces TaxID=2593676 RepID=UPI0036489C05
MNDATDITAARGQAPVRVTLARDGVHAGDDPPDGFERHRDIPAATPLAEVITGAQRHFLPSIARYDDAGNVVPADATWVVSARPYGQFAVMAQQWAQPRSLPGTGPTVGDLAVACDGDEVRLGFDYSYSFEDPDAVFARLAEGALGDPVLPPPPEPVDQEPPATDARSYPPLWFSMGVGVAAVLATRPSGFGETLWQGAVVFFAASGAVHIGWDLWHRRRGRTAAAEPGQ